MLPPLKSPLESWGVIRARMLRETELFLEDAFNHPEHQMRIPVIEVGAGRFTRMFAQLFWSQLLGAS
jgi:hypothetical protein